MYKNKIFWIIIILFALFSLFYVYRYIKFEKIGNNYEMFQIEKKEGIDIKTHKKYTIDNQSINYILDDYYEIDLD